MRKWWNGRHARLRGVWETVRVQIPPFAPALINSKISIYFIKQKYSSSSYNGGINFTKDMIKSLPFVKKSGLSEKIVEKVKQIMASKSENSFTDTSELENEIDVLMYESFSLSAEEIAIVEGRA